MPAKGQKLKATLIANPQRPQSTSNRERERELGGERESERKSEKIGAQVGASALDSDAQPAVSLAIGCRLVLVLLLVLGAHP